MAEYLIKHTGMQEEYYLKEVRRERSKDLQPIVHKRGRKWKCVKSEDEITPRGESIATWTPDETMAQYFRSRKEAENMIIRNPVLRFAVIIEA